MLTQEVQPEFIGLCLFLLSGIVVWMNYRMQVHVVQK
jgi:hypothetical protein